MARNVEPDVRPEDVERILSEKMNAYMQQYTAKIVLRNGYTYIGYGVYDPTTVQLMNRLEDLLRLMDVPYSTQIPFDDSEGYCLVLDGEDKIRAQFVQKFLDNGYKLNWK